MSRKQEITTGLISARQKILAAISLLPPARLNEVFLGVWSVKDLLAHLIGWDYTNIEAVKDILAGQAPRVFKQWDPEWANYNAELVRRYRRDRFGDMLTESTASHAALIEFIETIPAEDIGKDFGIRSPNGTNITVEWFLQFEIDDEGCHYDQVQDWLNRRARPAVA